MPICGLIENEILCMHGGLSPSISSLDQIREINRVKEVNQKGNMCDLLWSDPDDHFGWRNSPRGLGYTFGCDVSKVFNIENNLSLISRGHQLVEHVELTR